MKKLMLTVGCLTTITTALFAQTYMTRTGKISFNASAPSSPEKIEAINNEVANIIDVKTATVIFQAPIKSFKFERELMQEHFNENYLESDKYPRSDFKGTITNSSEISFTKDGTYTLNVTGKLSIHGVTKDVTVPGTITIKGNTVRVTAKFSVKLSDYNVAVPSVVADKIGKEAVITLESDLVPK
jgi:hypothetical protein